ncbi:hypothetical protein CONCODRAFT_78649 [Conidiobolus coronatus NRRL 28638]|uniref:Homeobox domain-containing protein n=1 Tax=Conidiobolus coronatus (strain ATCC 28846 / CBS 209.66 / NRRL 28638) TaxID=796925 RepID=A0A137P751_CONC2|nr:hypothetical protein CONCODRAFT_78649 [Conidiobolus coronatus NRRL 28638]|eukprot:KXN70847.1 hypothetical protein CONCODRAFT_78649 [Conidiobolus coronatus NRRL 28638]
MSLVIRNQKRQSKRSSLSSPIGDKFIAFTPIKTSSPAHSQPTYDSLPTDLQRILNPVDEEPYSDNSHPDLTSDTNSVSSPVSTTPSSPVQPINPPMQEVQFIDFNQANCFPPKKPRINIDKSSVEVLKEWLVEHINHPYPKESEKDQLAIKTKLSSRQIENWFINARRRVLKVEFDSEHKKKQFVLRA